MVEAVVGVVLAGLILLGVVFQKYRTRKHTDPDKIYPLW
jgi:hypothetical protein